MTNTQANIGLRRSVGTLGERNFENSGTVQYKATRHTLTFLDVGYNGGDALPFDVGGTSYSAAALAQLELFWNQGWIEPLA